MLRPDHYYSSVLTVDLDALASEGVRGILLDIDNTIVPRQTTGIPADSAAWVAALKSRFAVCLVSNNWHETPFEVAEKLGVEVVAKALKPLPFGFIAASRRLGVPLRHCAVIGDQIFTDVLGGRLCAARTVLVCPSSSNDLPHTLVLRRIEQRIMSSRPPEA